MSLSDAIVNGANIALSARRMRHDENALRVEDDFRRTELAQRRKQFDQELGFRKDVQGWTERKDARDYDRGVVEFDRTAGQEDSRIGIARGHLADSQNRTALAKRGMDYEQSEALNAQLGGILGDALVNGGDGMSALNAALGTLYSDPQARAQEGRDIADDPEWFGQTSDKNRPLIPLVTPNGRAAIVGRDKDGKPTTMTEDRSAGTGGKMVDVDAEVFTARLWQRVGQSPSALAQLRRAMAATRMMTPAQAEKATPEEVVTATAQALAERQRSTEQAPQPQPPSLGAAPSTEQAMSRGLEPAQGPVSATPPPAAPPLSYQIGQMLPTVGKATFAANPVGVAGLARDAAWPYIAGVVDNVVAGAAGRPVPSTEAPQAPAAPAPQPGSTQPPPSLASAPQPAPVDNRRRQAVLDIYNGQNLGMEFNANNFGAMMLTGNPNDAVIENMGKQAAADQKRLDDMRAKSTPTMNAAIDFVVAGGEFSEDFKAQTAGDMTMAYDITGGKAGDPEYARNYAFAFASLRNLKALQGPQNRPARIGAAVGYINAGGDPDDSDRIETATGRAANFAKTNSVALTHFPLLTELYATRGLTAGAVEQMQQRIAALDGAQAQAVIAAGGLTALPPL